MGAPKFLSSVLCWPVAQLVEQQTVKRQLLAETLIENPSNSANPKSEMIRQHRAKPERERVETRRRGPKMRNRYGRGIVQGVMKVTQTGNLWVAGSCPAWPA